MLIDVGIDEQRTRLYLADLASTHWEPESGGLSRAEIQRLIGEGQITLNDVKTKPSVRIRPKIKLIPFAAAAGATLASEALALDILHENADYLVINKAPGMVVHPAAGRWRGTLVNALLHHCPDLDGIGGVRRPGIVHRLDKETSGVMIAAKNMFAFQEFGAQFKNRTVEKEYVALAWGKIKPDDGLSTDLLAATVRTEKACRACFLSMIRQAQTEWRVEQRFAVSGAPHAALSLLRFVRVPDGPIS